MKKSLPLISTSVLLVCITAFLVFAFFKKDSPKVTLGGVVPHHNLAEVKIDEFWKKVSETAEPKTIFLVGPDHFNLAKAPTVLTKSQNIFPGYTKLEQETLTKMSSVGVVEDDSVFTKEHSIQIHIPYVYRYFPEASVVPILFRSDATIEEVIELAKNLRPFLSQETIVIASVDFSHYLSIEEARERDEVSMQALKTFDYDTLSHFGPDNADSDQSLIFMLEMVCPSHDCTWEQLFHGNSTDFDPANPFETTSYFSLLLKTPEQSFFGQFSR